jgi:signal peptidase I
MKPILWIAFVLVFVLGFLLSGILASVGLVSGYSFEDSTPEQASPQDRVLEHQIEVYPDRVILAVEGVKWASFADTNSMDPLIDKGANALQLVPESSDDIGVGDIVSYMPENGQYRVIHRVVYKGEDEQGVYFVVKGDNNPVSDPGKVRFEQIDRVLFAIIY